MNDPLVQRTAEGRRRDRFGDRFGAFTPARMTTGTAVVAPVVVAASLIPLRGRLDTADNALVLVVVIVAVATSGRRLAATAAALVSALSFDFFLTRPYESFRITRQSDLITELLLLVVGLAVGDLAARGRKHRREADQRHDHLARLHAVTELVAAGEDAHLVTIAAVAELQKLLSLRGCQFTAQDTGRVAARISPAGELTVGREYWSTATLGLPTKQVDLPVRSNGRVLGHFLLSPTPGQPVPHEHLLVAVAVADQVGAALVADHAIPA